MTPLHGRDEHLFIASDHNADRCAWCRRTKEDHNVSALFAHPYTYVGVSQREREREAEELAPSGMLFGGKR